MQPISVPGMDPLPPIRLAPPVATAAIASNSCRVPRSGSAAPNRPIRIIFVTAPIRPDIIWADNLVRVTGSPAMRAASGLPPTAMKSLPSSILFTMTQASKAGTATMITRLGRPKTKPIVRARKPSGRPKRGVPPVKIPVKIRASARAGSRSTPLRHPCCIWFPPIFNTSQVVFAKLCSRSLCKGQPSHLLGYHRVLTALGVSKQIVAVHPGYGV